MEFPEQILPRQNYLRTIEIDPLLQECNVILSRRSSLSAEDTFHSIGTLRAEAISYRDIPGMSLNLMGAGFESEHTYFCITGSGSVNWKGNTIDIQDFMDCYEFQKEGCIIFLDCRKIHSQPVNYHRTQDKPLKAEIDKFFEHLSIKPPLEDGKYVLEGVTQVKHVPTNLNYWHVELHQRDYADNQLTKGSSAYHKDVYRTILSDIISVCAQPEQLESDRIPSKFYLN
jgi:hypothetical protein